MTQQDDLSRLREAVQREPTSADLKAELGQALLAAGQYADAVSVISDCTRLEPDQPGHHAELGRACLALGRNPEAEAAYAAAIERVPDNPDYRAGRGWARARQGDHAGAVAAFRDALRYKHQDNVAHVAGLGQALLARCSYDEAAAALGRAVHLDDGNPEYRDSLGLALLGQERWAAAEQQFQQAAHLDPDAAACQAHLARALAAQGRHAEAEQAARAAIECDSVQPGYRAQLGEALAAQDRQAEAEAAFRSAIDLDPDALDPRAAAVQAGLGRSLAAQDRLDAAETALRRAIRLRPGVSGYHAELGRVLVAAARYADAEVAIRSAVQINASDPAHWAELGRVLLSLKRLGEAERALREAIRLDPVDPGYQADLGQLLLSRRQFAAAETHFRAALTHDPDNLHYQFGLARALSGQGQYAKAEKLLRPLVQHRQVAASSLAELGRVLTARGRQPEAQRLIREALRLEPSNAAYRAYLGQSFLADGRPEEAERQLREALRLEPDCATYHAGLGHALATQKKLAAALRSFEDAVRLDPSEAAYAADLGRALLTQDQAAAAEDALREATRLDPDHPGYQADLGRALLAQDLSAEAAKLLRRAVRLDPASPAYRADLGQALLAQDQPAAAEGAFREAIGLDPSVPAYRAGLGQALLAQDRPAAAEEAFREAIRLDPSVPRYRAGLGQACLGLGQREQAEIILDDLLRLSLSATDSSADELQAGIASAYDEEIIRYAWELAERISDKPSLQRRGISWLDYLDGVPRIARQQLPSLRGCYRSWSDARRGEQLERARTGSVLPGLRFRGRTTSSPASLKLEDQLVSLMTNLVLEPAEASALEVGWKDSADDRVSVEDGPELSAKAELANLITTDANARLTKAVNRTHGAAVALAGPRGCGKTELARRFTELQPLEPRSRVIPLLLSAPASYDDGNFLLRILKELCHSIMATGVGAEGTRGQLLGTEHRRRARLRALIASGLIGLGLAIPLTWAAGVAVATLAAFATGFALVLAGLTALVGQHRPLPPRSGQPNPISSPTIQSASDLLTCAEFTETRTRDAQIGFTGYGLSASAAESSQLARIPLNEIDVVRELRGLVRRVADEGWRVIIAIDELDKMSDDTEAMKFLNHIKVLFPIHDCSFIVSVSEDAWARYESRGIPLRDTFDSSFDEVVLVDMMRPLESRDFLKRRSNSITDTQALLCHCLSGGLPRDLLRAARLLARMAGKVQGSETTQPPGLDQVLAALLREDLEGKLRAFDIRRGSGQTSSGLTTPWSRIWPDEQQIQECLIAVCAGRHGPGSADHGPAAPGPDAAAELEVYIAVLYTIRQAFTPGGPIAELSRELAADDQPMATAAGFDCIARARRSIAADVGSAWQHLHESRRLLKLEPLTPPAAGLVTGPVMESASG